MPLPSVQIESGCELNMNKLFPSSSPASLPETVSVCEKKGGHAQGKMETRNLFAELFKIKGGGMGTKGIA